MEPNDMLASKLEHTLKINLLVQVAQEETPKLLPKATSTELTLGDLIQIKKKDKGEESPERKQS